MAQGPQSLNLHWMCAATHSKDGESSKIPWQSYSMNVFSCTQCTAIADPGKTALSSDRDPLHILQHPRKKKHNKERRDLFPAFTIWPENWMLRKKRRKFETSNSASPNLAHTHTGRHTLSPTQHYPQRQEVWGLWNEKPSSTLPHDPAMQQRVFEIPQCSLAQINPGLRVTPRSQGIVVLSTHYKREEVTIEEEVYNHESWTPPNSGHVLHCEHQTN